MIGCKNPQITLRIKLCIQHNLIVICCNRYIVIGKYLIGTILYGARKKSYGTIIFYNIQTLVTGRYPKL